MCDAVQMMGQNLRGEMNADVAGAELCLSDSRFIQVIAKSLSISCKEVSGTTCTQASPTQTPQHLVAPVISF